MEKQIIQSRSRCVSVWVDKWWYDILLIECLSLYFIPVILFFFRHGYPFFSLFFLGHALGMPSLLFFSWGNHSLAHILFFRDVPKRICHQKDHLFCGFANSQCRNFASGGGRVRDLDRENMKRFSIGSLNLTKLKEISSSICIKFSTMHDIWLW